MRRNDERLHTYRHRRILHQRQVSTELATVSNEPSVLKCEGLQKQLLYNYEIVPCLCFVLIALGDECIDA
jgi:hypothetical protein